MECETLQKVLLSLGIHSTLKVRNKQKDTYRIRIAKRSMPHLIGLVIPHMHTNMAPSYLFFDLSKKASTSLDYNRALPKLYYMLEHPKALDTWL